MRIRRRSAGLLRQRGWRKLLRWLAQEDGGTLVEFSVALVMLLTMIFAIMQASLILYTNHFLSYTAAEAVRYAIVRGSTWNNTVCTTTATESCTATATNVSNMVKGISPSGFSPGGGMTVTTTWTGLTPLGASCSTSAIVNKPGCVVQVQLSLNFNFYMPFLPNKVFSMSSTSAGVITQ